MKIDRTIKSPEGVSRLMENIWLQYKAGVKQHPCSVFMVDLPPLTEEEKAAILQHKKENKRRTRKKKNE